MKKKKELTKLVKAAKVEVEVKRSPSLETLITLIANGSKEDAKHIK